MLLRSVTFAVLLSLWNPHTEQWFKKSVITIKDLSEVPGMVLEPGTYVLKAEESPSATRAVVQLLNQDESQVLTSFIAVPDHRQRPEPESVITFYEGVTEGPRPIQTWFYTGEMNGYEFVYPKARAKQIAKQTDDHVMASESNDSEIVAITKSGKEIVVYDAKGQNTTKAGAATADVSREKPEAKPRPRKPKP
jgi:hypothetical protein